MSGLWCDPFDEYPSTAQMLDGLYAAVGSGCSITTANPRTGTKNLRINTDLGGGNDSFRRIFGSPQVNGAGVGFGFYMPALPNYEAQTPPPSNLSAQYRLMDWVTQDGRNQVSIQIGTDGAITCWSNAPYQEFVGGNLLGRSLPCLTARAYNYVEGFVYPHPTQGTVEVRVNGVTRLNLNNVNTDPHATGEVSQFLSGMYFSVGSGSIGMGNCDYDDLHAWNTDEGNGPDTFVGNSSVIYRPASADTAIADWALSTGTVGYVLLNDFDDSTYIAASTVGMKSAFMFTALPGSVAGVIYQQLTYRSEKTDGGDCDIAPFFVSSGTEADGDAQPITTAYAWRWMIQGEDPNTSGGPWTPASANACYAGWERTL